MREYVELNTLKEDGRLCHNNLLDTIEALIPNQFDSVHAADLLELENGDLLAAWFAGSNEGNADISIAVSRLKAGESTWSVGQIVSDDPSRSEQNPSLFQTPSGEIWLIYTAQTSRTAETSAVFNLQHTAEIRRKISKDNGYTWGPTETMFSRPGSFCRQKIQILSSGRWVFGNWICFPDESRNGSDITVIQISDDEGKTWREVEIPDSEGRVHANLIEMAPGKLTALFRSRFADYIYIAHSEDDGETWSSPQPTCLPNNNSSISAIKLVSGALAVIYNPVKYNEDRSKTVWPDQRCPVTIAISEDGGKTWPYRRVVEPGEGFVGEYNDINNRRYEYPVMMQSKDGNIHAAYSFGNRRCVKYVCVDEKWIRGEKMLPGAEGDPSMPCVR
ncbi:MAG: exo-alpha-sialidase [Lachnospiraceae bacterium]|nr:exo-alpha-sialidase [Lachnospiraceae bacterium]